MDPILGTIILFAGNFAPRGWAFCDGRLLSIAQNTALFSLLGTTYGGNGQTTFALPDLRGRVPIHAGNGPGLTPRQLGEQGGAETVTLTAAQMPAHNHGVGLAHDPNGDPALGVIAAGKSDTPSPGATQAAGSSQPHDNMQPFTALNYIIAVEGVYPSRD